MSGPSKIEWTERTWNPVRGCKRVSEGCRNCYAETIAARFSGPGLPYEGIAEMRAGKPRWTGKLALVEGALLEPLRRRKPTTYFVNSMSDLFHKKMPDAWIDRVFAVMALCPQHTFQVLTKRPTRMQAYLTGGVPRADAIADASIVMATANNAGRLSYVEGMPCGRAEIRDRLLERPLPNVWLGTSCENQATADERVPELLATPAAMRFVSAEPLLGPVDLRHLRQYNPRGLAWINALNGVVTRGDYLAKSVSECSFNVSWQMPGELPRLDWIIVGGESGPGARPMHPAWARSIRDQCAAAGVPFLFKQRGAWSWLHNDDSDGGEWPTDAGSLIRFTYSGDRHHGGVPMQRVGKKLAGRLLDGVEHNGMPSVRA